VLRQPDVIAIPKASTEAHVRDNARSLEIKLTKEDLIDLDREFPPPKSKESVAGALTCPPRAAKYRIRLDPGGAKPYKRAFYLPKEGVRYA
jgi:hypothetical protein